MEVEGWLVLVLEGFGGTEEEKVGSDLGRRQRESLCSILSGVLYNQGRGVSW